MVASGVADVAVGPLTITFDREQVVDFTHGIIQKHIKFYISRRGVTSGINLQMFLEPFTLESWAAFAAVILLAALTLFITTKKLNDPEANHQFTLWQSVTFACSGMTFCRRWSVSPHFLSGRIVFITILVSGLLCQGMWKAGLTSTLAVSNNQVPYSGTSELLDAGILPTVQADTAQEDNFRLATDPTFRRAWQLMEGSKERTQWTQKQDAISRVIEDPNLALYVNPLHGEIFNAVQQCILLPLPSTYFTSQWSLAISQDIPGLRELINSQILVLREAGVLDTLMARYNIEEAGDDGCFNRRQKGTALGLLNLASVFIAGLAGLIVAAILFLVEIVVTSTCKSGSK